MIEAPLAPHSPRVAARLGIGRRQEGLDGVALTFDDGPHPQGTPRVLEALREAGAPATFFCAGEQVERRPALVAEIVAAGHRVELHCHRHRNAMRLTRRQFAEDAERGRATIEEAAGVAIAYHRPPYGIYTGAALRHVRERGWRPLLWSRWGRDWRGGRRDARSPGWRAPGPARATSSYSTTPTTTAPPVPGRAPRRPCRSSSRSWTRAG